VFQFLSKKIFPLMLIHLLLVSCDGAAPGANSITPDNVSPVFSKDSLVSFDENSSAVIVLLATDADDDPLAYEITGGDDLGLFLIDSDSGELSFVSSPDFEAPADADGNNIYELIVAVDDSFISIEQSFFITVRNIDDNPPVASDLLFFDNNAGALVVGDTLTSSYKYSDIDNDVEGLTAVRWLQNGAPISGQTATSYIIQAADVGRSISFEVTPVSANGNSGTAVISAAALEVNSAPVASSLVLNSGVTAANVGDVLTTSFVFSDINSDPSISVINWLRDGAQIRSTVGVLMDNYTLVTADEAAVISVEVVPMSSVGTSPGLAITSATDVRINSAPTASAVVLNGGSTSANVGDSVTANFVFGDVDGDPNTSTINWLRDTTIIRTVTGVTSDSYTLTESDAASVLSVQVVPTSSSGTSPGITATSATTVTTNSAPTASSLVLNSGVATASVGDALFASFVFNDVDGDPNTSTINWLRGTTIIKTVSGVVTDNYTVVSADEGAVISVEVMPTSSSGTSPGVTISSATQVTINESPIASSLVLNGGVSSASVGDVLTTSYVYADTESNPNTSTINWRRGSTVIRTVTGVLTDNYTVVSADEAAALSVEVVPSSNVGSSPGVAVTSAISVTVNSVPTASSVSITGGATANVGDVLTGSFVFGDVDGDANNSTIDWLRGGTVIQTATDVLTNDYTVTVSDAGATLTLRVTPNSDTGSSPGIAVTSSGVAVPSNVSTKSVCTTDEHVGATASSNELGVSRYIRFDIVNNQNVDLVASRTSGVVAANPDLFLYKSGVLVQSAIADTSTTQSMTAAVTAGAYVLEVREASYTVDNTGVNETCYSVSITYGAGFAKPGGGAGKVSAPAQSEKSGASVSSCTSAGEVDVSGALSYERVAHNAGPSSGLDYGAITSMPIRGAVVEVICNADDLMYDTGVTDASGGYTLKAPDAQSAYIRVKAQLLDAVSGNWDFQVVDNTSAGALYAMDSSATPFVATTPTAVTGENYTAGSGWGGGSYTTTRVAAPFAILDSIYDAYQKVLAVDAAVIFPALNINWSTLNAALVGDKTIGEITTSHYDPATGEIYVLGDEDSDTDEYDKHVIIHEWAHYFEDVLSRSDSMGGAHGINDTLDMRIAFGEGFGNAYSGIASGDSVYKDSSGVLQGSGFGFDVNDDTACTNKGWFSECSVHSILFDIEGVIGFAPMYDVLIDEQKNTTALTSIFSFIGKRLLNHT